MKSLQRVVKSLLRGNKCFRGDIIYGSEQYKPDFNPILIFIHKYSLLFIYSIPGFVEPSVLSVIRLMTEEHLIFMSLLFLHVVSSDIFWFYIVCVLTGHVDALFLVARC